jgi:hypothetical protein
MAIRNRQKYIEDNPVKRMLWAAKTRANKKGLPFNITEEDIIIPTHCPILNIPLQTHTPRGKIRKESISLDRIIPELGYIKGNIEVISFLANTMKSNATPELLILFSKEMLKRYADFGG